MTPTTTDFQAALDDCDKEAKYAWYIKHKEAIRSALELAIKAKPPCDHVWSGLSVQNERDPSRNAHRYLCTKCGDKKEYGDIDAAIEAITPQPSPSGTPTEPRKGE